MIAIDLSDARRLAFGVVLSQALVTLIVALASLALAGRHAGLSAVLGGGIATAASLAMAALAFGRWAAAGAERMLAAFYVGEVAKLAVVIVLFVVVLRTMRPSPAPMFAAYAATFLVYWMVLAAALPMVGGLRRLRGPGG
ncbi:MAG: ATP synthase subunit I [Steroidobacteraceae bacterium]